jgi:hypothetical protein
MSDAQSIRNIVSAIKAELPSKDAIVQICTSLLRGCDYTRGANGKITVEKRYAVNYSIIDRLSRKDAKSFRRLIARDNARNENFVRKVTPPSDRIYDLARDSWGAFASTVVLHPEFDLQKSSFDFHLYEAIMSYKVWFFKMAFLNVHEATEDCGCDIRSEIHCPNLVRAINGLKGLSKWIVYYGSIKTVDAEEAPGVDYTLPGQLPGVAYQILGWYGGHLSRWRTPNKFVETFPGLTDPERKSIILGLAQMSTFGRALPTPPDYFCREELESVIEHLSGVPEYPREMDDIFWNQANSFGRRIGLTLDRPMGHTHTSTSASACFEATTEEGGSAGYLVSEIRRFAFTPVNRFFDYYTFQGSESSLYDPFGREIFGPARTEKKLGMAAFGSLAYRDSPRISSDRGKIPVNEDYVIHLMGIFGHSAEDISDIKTLLNENLGDIVLIWAWFQAMEYGSFSGLTNQLDCDRVPESIWHTLRFPGRSGKATFRCRIDSLECEGTCLRADLFIQEQMGVTVKKRYASPYPWEDKVYNIEDFNVRDFALFLVDRANASGANLDLDSVRIRTREVLHGGYRVKRGQLLPFFIDPSPKFWTQDREVECSLMVLAEPGFKARALTKNPVWLTILQSTCRHMVADVFSLDPRLGLGLESSYVLWDLLKVVRRENDPYRIAVNTDLSRSTDRIPMTLIRSMWSGFIAGFAATGKAGPLGVYRNLICVDHSVYVDKNTQFERVFSQMCGSFMGEPMSFMTLSLYNICCQEVASLARYQGLMVGEILQVDQTDQDPRAFETSKDAIVGDDGLRLTNDTQLGLYTRNVYILTNGSLSLGKDTESEHHAILAENHVFIDSNGKLAYLDIIKARLLSWVNREHSDHRDSLIGKGTALFQQLEWYEDTNGGQSAEIARSIYASSISRRITAPWVARRLLDLPTWLPPQLGGLALPIPATDEDLVNWFYGVATVAPFTDYLKCAMRIQNLNARRKRGFELPDLTPVISHLKLDDLHYLSGPLVSFDQSRKQLVPLDSVVTAFMATGPLGYFNIEVSPITQRPRVRDCLRICADTFGFIPLDVVLDQVERFQMFRDIFTNRAKPARLTISGYLSNLKEFTDWAKISRVGEYSVVKPHSMPLHGKNSLSWEFQKRKYTLVHKDEIAAGLLAIGPTLGVDLTRQFIRKQTRTGYNDQLDAMIQSWLSSFVSPNEEGEFL